ncbi:MAG: hypothetical protein JXR45_15020 [Deltaproteobacteria bacterium]|nr:hypothetical protein [Deltaproteobacteria bacterium]
MKNYTVMILLLISPYLTFCSTSNTHTNPESNGDGDSDTDSDSDSDSDADTDTDSDSDSDTDSDSDADADSDSDTDDCVEICTATQNGDQGTFCDSRDNHVYECVVIGNQIWMSENLNYGEQVDAHWDATDDGVDEKFCFDDDVAYCETYGALYQWAEMMGLAYSYNSTSFIAAENHQGICPEGWHVPDGDEWGDVSSYVGSNGTASCGPTDSSGTMTENCVGYDLKSSSGWGDNEGIGGPGTDLFGFNGLAGGMWYYDEDDGPFGNNFDWAPFSVGGNGFRGLFFVSQESGSTTSKVYHLGDDRFNLGAYNSASKLDAYSLRCVQN